MFHDDGIHTFLANFCLLLLYYLKLASLGHLDRHGLRHAEYSKDNRSLSAAAGILRGYNAVYRLTPLERKRGAPGRLSIVALVHLVPIRSSRT
jgi:hypothetical protein